MTQRNKGCFKKGTTPWNKGKHFKAGGRSVETQFKKGLVPHNYRPIGTVVAHSDGYRYIKIAEHKWQSYQRYLWEKVNHKKLKRNQIVLFLDGNRDNYKPDNLAAISRKELAIINREKLLTKDNSELSKAGILIAKLKIKINDKKEK
ncbi:HNH endonuclease [Lactobacillus helveticus]|uniref:HNH endonuclease n=1 Tax=Lactobacillus helveticus TaxID=1587 RepID=UPI001567155F|nr:HNH endonuclease [Lactobacillus helveticus]NRO92861.1 hypothetical protein [Lactobacillus helveticus]